jgi:hypothetical protein
MSLGDIVRIGWVAGSDRHPFNGLLARVRRVYPDGAVHVKTLHGGVSLYLLPWEATVWRPVIEAQAVAT